MRTSNRFDRSRLPAPLLTSEPGSFARRTFEERVPRMLDDVIAANDFSLEIVQALRALRDEITDGVIRLLGEGTPDKSFWDAQSREHVGKSWLDVPWYWAETFFYRRVLEAVRYFQPGAWYHRDPFANTKRGELAPQVGPSRLRAILEHLPSSPQAAFYALLHASLWGNRVDLSYTEVAQSAPGALALERERANLLADDAARVWEHLQARRGGRIDFICDNAGTELLFDLALADFLLQAGLARQVIFHLKPHPFFVSDAMVEDVHATLDALAQSSASELSQLAQRLERTLAEKRWGLAQHPFWVTSLFHFEMPEDLRAVLAQADLVISKGDANYRRLWGDSRWPPTTPFELVGEYFPAPVLALRTLKAELIVGLREGEAEQLQAQDPAWLVNGRRGVVQFAEINRTAR